MMKQPQYEPLSVAEMSFSLFAANEGYLDNMDVPQVVPFEQAMQAYMRSNYADLLAGINDNPVFDDEVAASMKDALDDFVKNGSW